MDALSIRARRYAGSDSAVVRRARGRAGAHRGDASRRWLQFRSTSSSGSSRAGHGGACWWFQFRRARGPGPSAGHGGTRRRLQFWRAPGSSPRARRGGDAGRRRI